MPDLFRPPSPDLVDSQVIGEVHDIRASLAAVLRMPRRWTGGLRRTSAARAIQGSNTIEGYTVSTEDAAAAFDDEPPLSVCSARAIRPLVDPYPTLADETGAHADHLTTGRCVSRGSPIGHGLGLDDPRPGTDEIPSQGCFFR